MDTLTAACRERLGSPPVRMHPLHGGDLSEVRLIRLEDGRDVVAKLGPLVAREARMLTALSAAGAPAPAVLDSGADVLLMEYIPQGRPDARTWPRLGEDLARLHATVGPAYGWEEDYAFGPVGIDNRPLSDWPRFWAERRLRPALPHLPAALGARVEALARRLPELLPAAPPTGLLHGDLWSGNLHIGLGGRAWLIDPACYHGDGEVDLAMLHLFGHPGRGFAESYGPLAPGWQARRAVYSLWPALVHLRLFGAGYRALVERFLSAAGS